MRILTFTAITILLFTKINAASLKNLSEKLSSFDGVSDNVDNTKEKIPNEGIAIMNDENKNSFRELDDDDDDVKVELDKLKAHNDVNNRNKEAVEKLEDSLKKLHNSHHKTHANDDSNKPITSPEHYTFNHNDEGAKETSSTINQHHQQQQQKEIYENIPLPDASEVTTSTNKNNKGGAGYRLSIKNEQLSLNPTTMLRHLNGKYSAYDMAQYIFWTGDEEGVAKAVEELIDEGLMSRENAIEFLNDIRLGIDYLENMYSLKQNEGKNMRLSSPIAKLQTTTTSEPSALDDIPFTYGYNYQKFHSFFKPSNKDKVNIEEDEMPTLSPIALKTLEKIPSLIKLTTESHRENGNKQESPSFETNDDSGRTRLADFLFGEYSLEEVIYQLAKTMFTQSLTHGSEESQAALQKLTQFLENEGKHGRISPALQKKILDVLLAALSDTLSENPEVMEKARHALTTK